MIHGLRQANLHNLKNQALLNKNWIRSYDVFVKLLLAFHLKTGYKFCVNKLHDLSYAAESLCVYLMGTEIFPYLHRKVARIDFRSTVLPWPFPGTTCVNPIAKASLCVRAHTRSPARQTRGCRLPGSALVQTRNNSGNFSRAAQERHRQLRPWSVPLN